MSFSSFATMYFTFTKTLKLCGKYLRSLNFQNPFHVEWCEWTNKQLNERINAPERILRSDYQTYLQARLIETLVLSSRAADSPSFSRVVCRRRLATAPTLQVRFRSQLRSPRWGIRTSHSSPGSRFDLVDIQRPPVDKKRSASWSVVSHTRLLEDEHVCMCVCVGVWHYYQLRGFRIFNQN